MSISEQEVYNLLFKLNPISPVSSDAIRFHHIDEQHAVLVETYTLLFRKFLEQGVHLHRGKRQWLAQFLRMEIDVIHIFTDPFVRAVSTANCLTVF